MAETNELQSELAREVEGVSDLRRNLLEEQRRRAEVEALVRLSGQYSESQFISNSVLIAGGAEEYGRKPSGAD